MKIMRRKSNPVDTMRIIRRRRRNPDDEVQEQPAVDIDNLNRWLVDTQEPVEEMEASDGRNRYHCIYEGPFVPEPEDIDDYGLSTEDLQFLNDHHAAIALVECDDPVSVSWYHTIDDAELAWDSLTSDDELEEWETEEEEEEEE